MQTEWVVLTTDIYLLLVLVIASALFSDWNKIIIANGIECF
jgi:hypothetical protein